MSVGRGHYSGAPRPIFSTTSRPPWDERDVDGNKRAAHLIAFTLLDVNGYTLSATEDEQFDLMMAVAGKGLDVDSVEDWLRRHLVRGSL